MMILRSSPPSPFGRKVKLAAGHSRSRQATSRSRRPIRPIANDSIRKQNPLGKIPALIIEDGTVLYDSPVILEYLDHRAGGGKIVPQEPNARFAALTLQALCDGILDACILLVYEGRWRPAEKHEQKWIDYQTDKVTRAFDVLEAAPPALDAIPNVGAITLACALGYQDLRFGGKWRAQLSEAGEVARRFEAQRAGLRDNARDGLTVRHRPTKQKLRAGGPEPGCAPMRRDCVRRKRTNRLRSRRRRSPIRCRHHRSRRPHRSDHCRSRERCTSHRRRIARGRC